MSANSNYGNDDEPLVSMDRESPYEKATDTPADDAKSKKEREDALMRQFQGVAEEAASAKLHAQLVTDPEIRAILEARQTGKKVKIIPEDQLQQQQQQQQQRQQKVAAEENIDYEQLTNKQLSDHLATKMEEIVTSKGRSPEDEQEFNRMKEQIAQLTNHIKAQEGEKAKSQIDEAKKKYPDFEELKGEMHKAHLQSPSLSIDELYLLARVRSGRGLPEKPLTRRELETERPNSTVSRGDGENRERRTAMPKLKGPALGSQGFTSYLNEYLSKKDFAEAE